MFVFSTEGVSKYFKFYSSSVKYFVVVAVVVTCNYLSEKLQSQSFSITCGQKTKIQFISVIEMLYVLIFFVIWV